MTIGAPTNDVIALIGSVKSLLGNCAILSQISITILPNKSTAGNKTLWFDVLNTCLVICGMAKPIKAIGPAKAVMVPANKLVAIMMVSLLFLIFSPKLL